MQEKSGKEYIKHKEIFKSTLFYQRSLDNKQLLAIKRLDGIVGVVTHKQLSKPVIDKKEVADKKNDAIFLKALANHFIYLKNLFGDCNNISVASDDTTYEWYVQPEYYLNANHFKLNNIDEEIRKLLSSIQFNNKEINKITKENFENIIWKNV